MNPNDSEEDLFSEAGNFYFKNDKLHDVQFVVGEQEEKIKAVRLPLINQSKAWWSMLSEDSPLTEKGDIHLPDIDPEVFNLLLRHCYGGLKNLDDLSHDTVIKLCYCANKYFMSFLFEKIATRLQPRNVEELFPALHCLVYYNLKGVEENVIKVIQTQTTKILDHPEFLECDVDSVTYICKQETLSCEELTLWKAVVKWAKHKGRSDEGPQLRQWISSPLQHIRLITMSASDLQDHVFSLDILSLKEITSVCRRDLSLTPSLCDEKFPRIGSEKKVRKVDVLQKVDKQSIKHTTNINSTSCFVIKNRSIEIQSLVVRGYGYEYNQGVMYFGSDLKMSLTVKITRITNLMSNTSDEEPVIINLKDFNCPRLDKMTVPTVVGGKGITLQANSKYKVELTFGKKLPCWDDPDCVNGHDFDHGTFFCSLVYNNGVGLSPCHIMHFTYSVADD